MIKNIKELKELLKIDYCDCFMAKVINKDDDDEAIIIINKSTKKEVMRITSSEYGWLNIETKEPARYEFIHDCHKALTMPTLKQIEELYEDHD